MTLLDVSASLDWNLEALMVGRLMYRGKRTDLPHLGVRITSSHQFSFALYVAGIPPQGRPSLMQYLLMDLRK